MGQPPASVNFYIRDANGQPQMVKVVQTRQSIAQIHFPSSAVKSLYSKAPTSEGNASKSVTVTGIKNPKFVQVPAESIGQYQKSSADSSVQSAVTVKKVQTTSNPEVAKLIRTVPTLMQQIPKPPTATIKQEEDNAFLNNTILGYGCRKRKDSEIRVDYSSKRRKIVEKVGKGLRHFSMKVCEKVRKKGFTSYNEVADELVAEFTQSLNACSDNQHYDQKNIRRRVYDALNVLMAMNIISKEKKEIRWIGLPTNSVQECTSLEAEKSLRLERIQQKTQQLHDLILKQISFKCLVERNKEAESKGIIPSPTSTIQLPFIVINTNKRTLVDCSISNDKREYVFRFNEKFQIQDDIDILKRMGLLLGLDKGNCMEDDLQLARSMVPKSLECYVNQMGKGDNLNIEEQLSNIKSENYDYGEGSTNGEEEMEDEYSPMMFSEGEEDDPDSCSDVDVN